MDKSMKRLLLSVAASGFLTTAFVVPSSAVAASAIIEQAKDQCIVGEQADGYLGFVPGGNASAELRREVRDVNQQRKSIYADLARRNGVSIEVTAALTAEKLLSQAQRGECIRDAQGNWREV